MHPHCRTGFQFWQRPHWIPWKKPSIFEEAALDFLEESQIFEEAHTHTHRHREKPQLQPDLDSMQ